jgi:hypothetical protein
MGDNYYNQSNLTPILNNSDFVRTCKTYVNHDINDVSYENFILYNLAKNITPNDISDNIVSNKYDIPINIDHTYPSNENDHFNTSHVVINNDETIINSESFAINVQYSSTIPNISDMSINYQITNRSNSISSYIELSNNSVSYFDSNIKIDISYNTDPQITYEGNWNVEFDRSLPNMNYFAAINSNLNTSNGSYPFYISEDTEINTNSLYVDGYYFTKGDNNKRVLNNLENNNTLSNNGLSAYYNTIFTGEGKFGTYRIRQSDISNVRLDSTLTESDYENLAIRDFNNNVLQNGDSSIIDFNQISSYVNSYTDDAGADYIDDGFTATLNVGYNDQGGYSIEQNNYADNDGISIDYSKINNYFDNNRINYYSNSNNNGHHYIKIDNTGSLTIDDNEQNRDYVELSSGNETLDISFSDKSGAIFIQYTPPENRVTYDEKNPSTNNVYVYYNNDEYNNNNLNNDYLSDDNKHRDNSYFINLLVEATGNQTSATFDENDNRNLKKTNNDTRLCIAHTNPISNSYPSEILNQISFNVYNDYQPLNSEAVTILHINNSMQLVNDTQLCSSLSNNEIDTESSIPNTSVNILLKDSNNINEMNQYGYRLNINTKTIDEFILDGTFPNGKNNWNIISSNESNYLLGSASHVSEIINDDAMLINMLNTQTDFSVNVIYTFNVTNFVTSINSIKYYFDATLNDPTNDMTQCSKFGGNNDISFVNIVEILNDKISVIQSSNSPNSTYVLEKWIRRRQYNAQIDPSLPFYENILLQTSTIYEETIYYRGWTNSERKYELSSDILSRIFDTNNNNTPLNTVEVYFVESLSSNKDIPSTQIDPPSVTLNFNKSNLSILSGYVEAKSINNDNWVSISNTYDIEPFIYQLSDIIADEVSFIDNNDGSKINATFELNIIIPNIVNLPNYYIGISKPQGILTTLTAKLYIKNYNNFIEYFDINPYANTDVDFNQYDNEEDYVCSLSLDNNNYKIDIYDNNENHIADITFPSKYLLNFNIIYSPNNVFSIFNYNTESTSFDYNTRPNSSNIVTIDSGIYLDIYTTTITTNYRESFSLNKDKVNIQFIDNTLLSSGNYYTNNDNYYGVGYTTNSLNYKNVEFNNVDSNGVDVLTVSNNETRSISLKILRGYYVSGESDSQNGYHKIIINRSPAVYSFHLDTEYNGNYTQILKPNYENIINQLSNNTNIINIGLVVKTTYSIIDYNTNQYDITFNPADYYYEFKNPDNSLSNSGSGYLNESILNNFFNFKIIYSVVEYPFTLTYTYSGSPLTIDFSDTYIDNPVNIKNWVSKDNNNYPINVNKIIDNYLTIQRSTRVNGSFTSYLVVAPPEIGITFNGLDNIITTLPIDPNMTTPTTVYYDILSNKSTIEFNLKDLVNNSNLLSSDVIIRSQEIELSDYKYTEGSMVLNFVIEGNNIELNLYSGLNNHTEILSPIYKGLINGLIYDDSESFNVNNFNTVGYEIYYRQPTDKITSSNNTNYNIHFTIDNAFIPPNNSSSYLLLKTGYSSNITLYDTNTRFNNGRYHLYLNKYELNTSIDYNNILSNSSNINEIIFNISTIYQSVIPLNTNGNHPLLNSNILTVNKYGNLNIQNNLLSDLSINDINTSWVKVSDFSELKSIGISIGALDISGVEFIKNLIMSNVSYKDVNYKTLFVLKQDIMKLNNVFGNCIFRLTNNGNIIIPKITTSNLTMFTQSLNTSSHFISVSNQPLINNSIEAGLISENTLDFSGSLLINSSTSQTL